MATSLTANAVVEMIRSQVSRNWMGGTSEGFQCGDLNATVTGIATAWTPTIEALQKAISLNLNLMISMEPPFWRESGPVFTEVSMGTPSMKVLEASSVYQYKKKLIDDHGLILWRFNENYRALASNPRLNALARTLGYKAHENAAATQRLAAIGAGVYAIPEIPLADLAKKTRDSANAKALRVLGDPKEKVKSVALLPGYIENEDIMAMVRDRNVDVVVCGEPCEWEAFEYAEDWITAGWGKGMIMLGRAASEDPGAKELAAWMRSFITDVPVTGIAVGEPFSYVPSHKA
ncbi:MAG: Nif3-like dinuclear metal center hexameric protein [Acidobacteriia bacterium]|nr:Nif3-like dinuclear metal center hexameric protein [Terriglobia bacterium]